MSYKDWVKYKLEDLYDINPETSSGKPIPGTEYIYLTPKKITGNLFLPQERTTFSDETDKNLIFSSVKKGDIFWAVQQEKDMALVALNDFPLIAFSRSVKQLRLKKNPDVALHPEFITYYLRSPLVYRQMAKYSSSSIRFSIINNIINNLEIVLPSEENQIRIGRVLKTLDDKIKNNSEMNRTLTEMAHTLFSDWFLHFRSPSVSKKKKYSELGFIPEDWEVISLEEFCEIQTGYPFKSENYTEKGEVGIVKIKNIRENFIDILATDFVETQVVASIDNKYKLESNALLIALSGSDMGKVGLVPPLKKNQQLWLNQRIAMCKEKSRFGNFFLYLLLSTDTYQSKLRNLAMGTAQPNISITAIEKIRAIIPPANLIKQFGEKVYPMFERILANHAENENLELTRNNLLNQLISAR